MAKDQKEQGSFTALWMVLALLGAIGTWMLITPEHLLKSLTGERAFVTELSGQQADQWIFSKMISVSVSQIQGMSDAIKDTQDTPGALKEWIQNRIVVTWLWGSLIVYRVNLLMLFWFILMPFTIAVAIDGYSTRMIRTFQFSSQSPIRHRIGVLISTIVMFGVAIWLVLPIPLPSVVAPLAIVSIGWATWMWVSNLQKRI
ncbi:MAG: DUF4400 domain-containing protein [Candidatus Nitrotoga sp.]